MSITSSRADAEHQPCVLVINSSGGVSQEHLTQVTTKVAESDRALKEKWWW